MNGRRIVGFVLTGLLAVFVVSMATGMVLGQPMLLGYVETGSMSPTMEPGDGFVPIPTALTGSIEPGDVIVFEAEVIDGGGLTTHRVVAETEEGFITRGDANVVTDQDSGEPPVTRDRIVAEALQVGDWLVVIPKIGVVIGAVQSFVGSLAGSVSGAGGPKSIAYVIFGVGVAAYLATVLAERRDDQRHVRGSTRRDDGAIEARYVVLVGTLAIVALTTGAMVGTGGSHEFGVVSAETDSPRQYVISAGSTENATYSVPSYGLFPAAVILEPSSENLTVEPERMYVPGGSSTNATVALTAPPETGYYPQYLIEHRYVGFLPVDTIGTLHEIHPWLPVVVIDVLVGVGVLGLGFALVGDRRIRLDSRSRDLPLSHRLRQWFR